jgi:hypothetical protein
MSPLGRKSGGQRSCLISQSTILISDSQQDDSQIGSRRVMAAKIDPTP